MRVLERVLAALDARVGGSTDDALAALTEAATVEDGIPAVGPPVVLPAREQLAGLLLDLGRLPEAAAAFDSALLRTPNRSATLLGRARVAARAGDAAAAKRYYGRLLANWRAADSDLPELTEARAAVARAEAAR
jgi:tetratricopeptide (TPR) repeat protein